MMNTSEFTLLVDDKKIEHFNMKLIKYETQSYVSRKTSGINIPGAHGTKLVPSSLASNSFVASVVCHGDNSTDVQNSIRQFFAYMYSTQDTHKIVFTDDAKICRYAILDSPDNYKVIRGEDGALAELKLTFLMPDPFAYQCDSDRFVTVAQSGQTMIFGNEAFECPAVFKLHNVGNTVIKGISLVINNEPVNFSCSLNPGDVLTLDTVEYEVLYNSDVRLDYWSGEMPMLKNGDNAIVQSNSSNADLLLSVEFTKQWV